MSHVRMQRLAGRKKRVNVAQRTRLAERAQQPGMYLRVQHDLPPQTIISALVEERKRNTSQTHHRFRENRHAAPPLQEEREQIFSGKEEFFATAALPFRHEKFAARTSEIGKTSAILCERIVYFLGSVMVPKSQKWQTFLTTSLCKAEQFTLSLRQISDSMQAIVPGKAH
jgi:hypothetical protein